MNIYIISKTINVPNYRANILLLLTSSNLTTVLTLGSLTMIMGSSRVFLPTVNLAKMLEQQVTVYNPSSASATDYTNVPSATNSFS